MSDAVSGLTADKSPGMVAHFVIAQKGLRQSECKDITGQKCEVMYPVCKNNWTAFL